VVAALAAATATLIFRSWQLAVTFETWPMCRRDQAKLRPD
jgi:hypothetical protein